MNNNSDNKWQQGTKHICTSDQGHVCVHADNVVAIKIHNANQQQQQQHDCGVPQQVWHAQEHSSNITTHTGVVECDGIVQQAVLCVLRCGAPDGNHDHASWCCGALGSRPTPLCLCNQCVCHQHSAHTHKAHDPQHACHTATTTALMVAA